MVVVFKGCRDVILFEKRDPIGPDFFRDNAFKWVMRGVGSFVIDGKAAGDVCAGGEGFLQPEGLSSFNGLKVSGVEENQGEIRAKINGA